MLRPLPYLPKASEKWGDPMLGEMLDAFPTISDLVVRVGPFPERVFRRENLGRFVDCIAAPCYGGGFFVQAMLEDMVRDRRTSLDTPATCMGRRAFVSRSGVRRILGPCGQVFRVRIAIKYVES